MACSTPPCWTTRPTSRAITWTTAAFTTGSCRCSTTWPKSLTSARRPSQQAEFAQFCEDEAEWLEEYALFMALKVEKETAWNEWPLALRSREADALAQARARLADEVHGHQLNQWFFYRQWTALKRYANDKGVQIVGDIPIYVAMDSADVWADPQAFQLDEAYQPTVVAGVPPDYFSETGQLWGNPIYRWAAMQANGYAWWLRRIRAALRLYDIVRIDHFRGFAGYWEVPADEETAMNGQWRDGPGADFFETVRRELGDLPIIAEDLGDITRDVIELRDQFDLPGMKILQFAFATDASHKFLPHNYTPNFVVYPGTHDNDTAWGWYTQSSSEQERDHFRRYYRTDGHDAAWTMLESAFASVAHTAIVTLQDVLNLGAEARPQHAGPGIRQLGLALPAGADHRPRGRSAPGCHGDLWPRPANLRRRRRNGRFRRRSAAGRGVTRF